MDSVVSGRHIYAVRNISIKLKRGLFLLAIYRNASQIYIVSKFSSHEILIVSQFILFKDKN